MNDWTAIERMVRRHGAPRRVAIEACTGAAQLADELIAHAGWPVRLAHPGYVARLKQSPDKSDYSAARLLADLERVGYLPPVWLAPEPVRELRRLVRYRQQLVGERRNIYYNSYPDNLTNVGGKLYFSAGDARFGNELRTVSENSATSSASAGLQPQAMTGPLAELSSAERESQIVRDPFNSDERTSATSTSELAADNSRRRGLRMRLSPAAIDALLGDLRDGWK